MGGVVGAGGRRHPAVGLRGDVDRVCAKLAHVHSESPIRQRAAGGCGSWCRARGGSSRHRHGNVAEVHVVPRDLPLRRGLADEPAAVVVKETRSPLELVLRIRCRARSVDSSSSERARGLHHPPAGVIGVLVVAVARARSLASKAKLRAAPACGLMLESRLLAVS